jgi:hypothetical protein
MKKYLTQELHLQVLLELLEMLEELLTLLTALEQQLLILVLTQPGAKQHRPRIKWQNPVCGL